MALNVYDQTGTINIAGQTFGPGGGQVSNGMLSGTEAQLNADLASLSYTAGANAGADTLSVDVWDQHGVEITKTIPIQVGQAQVGAAGTQPSASAQMAFINDGTGQVIDAGPGAHMLQDDGSNNTIVLPAAGKGSDTISGDVLQNGDQFDMRGMLAATSWTGDPATLGDFVSMGTDASGNGVISVNPTGAGGGSSTAVATLVGSGAVPLSTLMAHSITQ